MGPGCVSSLDTADHAVTTCRITPTICHILVTGALPPTALGSLIKEAGLRSAESLLNNRVRRFGLRLLSTPSRGPDGETIINPASEMIRESPRVVANPRFPENDPRWNLPGYNRKKELAALWKGPKTLADRLWDAATGPIHNDIPEGDLSRRSRLRSPVLVEATRMLWTQSSLKGRVVIEDAEAAQATAEAWTPAKWIAIFTDGSKFEDGHTGCAAVWKDSEDVWRGRKLFLGRNKEVFDAEIYAIWVGLKAAKERAGREGIDGPGPRAVTIFTDAQAALKRIGNDAPGPGQWLVRRILHTERQLRRVGWATEFRWVPGHKGIEGNEVADQWAKEGAEASAGAEYLPEEEESITTLAHVARGITEAKWNEHIAWIKERCRGKRYYLLRERQHTDPVASRARKATAARFYQLRMNKAPTGPYLAEVGQAEDDKCWWCSSSSPGTGPSQIREHLFKHCRRWTDQQATMWRAIGKATGRKRTNTSMTQLFGDERCTAAILGFLETTEVGVRGKRRVMVEEAAEDGGEADDSDETENDERQSEDWEGEDDGG
jgi:ribonuclease HI